MPLRAQLVAATEDPEVGDELIRVVHDDGSVEELRLHDYDRLYALPGVYEAIVSERLACASPARIATLLAAAVDAAGWDPRSLRVLDVAAGNGVSGEALAEAGLGGAGLYGTDIVASARAAAERDRPGLYAGFRTLDLLALSDEDRDWLRGVRATVLACVAPVGDDPSQVPVGVLFAAARALGPDALVGYMHDPAVGHDVVTASRWRTELGMDADEVARERYVHRQTLTGAPYEMNGVVWRVRRPD